MLLGGRQIIGLLLASAAAVFLSKWLSPRDFGLFAQISFWTTGASALVVGDLGLVLSLVRLPEEPSENQWRSVETIAILLSLLTLVLLGIARVALIETHHIRLVGLTLPLGFSVALRFMRMLPSARLQRDHAFSTIALGELAEVILYFGLALTLAHQGFGVRALAYAVLLKEVAGLAWIRIRSRQIVRPALGSLRFAKPLLRIGIKQQGTGILVSSTDAFQPVVIGGMLGLARLGLVSWAYAIALLPLTFLASLDRVLLPALAKVQGDSAQFRKWIERCIRLNCLIASPIIAIFALWAREITLFAFHAKWLPAVFLLTAFLPAIGMTAISTPIFHGYNVLGRTGVAFKLAAVWAALTWTLGLIAVRYFELRGYAWFYVLLQVTYLPLWLKAHQDLGVNVVRAAFTPIASMVAVGSIVLALPRPQSLIQLFPAALGLAAAYLGLMFLLDRAAFRNDWQLATSIFRRGNRSGE